MKKQLLLAVGLGLTLPVMAETAHSVIPEFFSQKISADGSTIYSMTYDEAMMYKLADGKVVTLPEFRLGNGNCVTNDGRIVVGGTDLDAPVFLVDGKEVDLSVLADQYRHCDLHGITGDGKRVVGLVSNPEEGTETNYVPAYWDVNEDYTLGEINFLPYPAKDWLNLDVQYCSAVFVSDDGKTILGQVVDWSGMSMYPIIYSQNEKGEWSYSLPTESLINPNKIPIPEFPGEFTMQPPYYGDYMTPEELEAYEAALNEFWMGEAEEPAMGDYMTAAQITAYNKAVDEFNAAAEVYNEAYAEFLAVKEEIEMESVFFTQNAQAMSADGKIIGMNALVLVENNDPMSWFPWEEQQPTYVLNRNYDSLEKIKEVGNSNYPAPQQILSDGTIISSLPNDIGVGGSYVLPAGSDEYVEFAEFYETKNPAGVAWLRDNFTKMIAVGVDFETWEDIYEEMLVTGHVVVSDDWSVVSGGIEAGYYSDEYLFESYLFAPDYSGVVSIDADVKVVEKKYYDINGLEVKNPEKGIFVEKVIFSDGSAVTSKKVK